MNPRTLAFSAAALLAAACATARVAPEPVAATPQSAVESYFPLAVGNRWSYETRFGSRVETNTVSIVEEEGGVFTDNRNNRLFVDEEGLRDERRYLLRLPLAEGSTWKSIIDIGKRESYEIVDIDATVTVPAGTFEDVLLVRGRSPIDPGTVIEVEWSYAPRVGLVRITTTAVIGPKRIPQARTELTGFSVR